MTSQVCPDCGDTGGIWHWYQGVLVHDDCDPNWDGAL